MTYTFTFFRPARPSQRLDDRAYAAVHAKQTVPTRVVTRRSLKGVQRWIERHAVEGRKGDGGYLVAGVVEGRREGDCTGPAPFALIDYDGAAPDWRALSEYEGFAWTTASHTDEKPAWRVVIPFVVPAEHGALRCPFEGGYIRNRSQPAFLPTRQSGMPVEVGVEWRELGGFKRLDAATLEPKRAAQEPRSGAGATGRGHVPDLSALVVLVPPAGVTDGGGGRHILVRAIGGFCTELGFSPDEIYEAVYDQIPTSDPEFRAEQAKDAAYRRALGLETVGFSALRDWCEARKGGKKAFRELRKALTDPDMPDGFPGVWDKWWRDNYSGLSEVARELPAQASARTRAEKIEHGAMNEHGTQTCPRTGWPWILQRNATYWIHDPEIDTYGAQFSAAELEVRVRETYVGRGLLEPGEPSKLAGLKEHGWIQAVEQVVYDYRTLSTTYDGDERKVRCAALRRMPPERAKFHAPIDRWLRTLFVGEHYDRVSRWIASCSHLDRLAPCLYVVCLPEGGKGLLFNGLARLWGCSSPVPMAEVISDFNEKQIECPLVYADEGLPEGLSFTRFRSMVSDHDRRVNRKGIAKVDVAGCTRNAVGANNPDVLRWAKTGTLTRADQLAIAERLLVIECSDEAARASKTLLERAPVHDWTDGGWIAEHALWLASQVEIRPQGRWCVEPSGGDKLVDAVVNDRYAAFATAVLRGLEGGVEMAKRTHVWRSTRHDRTIFVHAQHLHQQMISEDRSCTLSGVKEACKSFALGDAAIVQQRIPGTDRSEPRICVYAVDASRVYEAAGMRDPVGTSKKASGE